MFIRGVVNPISIIISITVVTANNIGFRLARNVD